MRLIQRLGGNFITGAVADPLQSLAKTELEVLPIASHFGRGGAKIKLQIGSLLLETGEGASGMIPGGEDDNFTPTNFRENREGDNGIFAGRERLIFVRQERLRETQIAQFAGGVSTQRVSTIKFGEDIAGNYHRRG